MSDSSQCNLHWINKALNLNSWYSSCYLDGEGGAVEPVIIEDLDGGDRPFSCPRCGRRYKRKNNAGRFSDNS